MIFSKEDQFGRDSIAELLLEEIMRRIIAPIAECGKEDAEDHSGRESLAEDNSSLLGEMMRRIIASNEELGKEDAQSKWCAIRIPGAPYLLSPEPSQKVRVPDGQQAVFGQPHWLSCSRPPVGPPRLISIDHLWDSGDQIAHVRLNQYSC